MRANSGSRAARGAKRCIDVMGSALLLALTAPILAICALAILATSGAPVIFRQQRVGLRGRSFLLYKLRTMHVEADALLSTYLDDTPDAALEWRQYRRLQRDPRIIPGLGHLLRRTSLDELPQLWNVLRGDLSLVGPRPLVPDYAESLPAEKRTVRESVPPGLTGLWQVSGRGEMDVATLVQIDEAYIRDWSLLADLRILARTPGAVWSGRGAY